MFPVDGGGYIIDTPGIKGFGTFDMEEEEVGHSLKKYLNIPLNASMETAPTGTSPDAPLRDRSGESI